MFISSITSIVVVWFRLGFLPSISADVCSLFRQKSYHDFCTLAKRFSSLFFFWRKFLSGGCNFKFVLKILNAKRPVTSIVVEWFKLSLDLV